MIQLFGLACFVRAVLIGYGLLHDKYLDVKYTDIDYTVFTDAAEYISNGESPYMKETYKYTPMLAIILLPNIYLNQLFGKLLFCCFDLLVGYMQLKMLKSYCELYWSKVYICLFWLYNPFTMTISSRGNAEAIQIFLVVATLLFVSSDQIIPAGVCFGLSVHFKLYPVIYALPFVLSVGKSYYTVGRKFNKLLNTYLAVVHIAIFSIISLVSFVLAGSAMYYLYGYDFIQQTYLFHFSRVDTQHNFSPYFYILLKYKDTQVAEICKVAAFIPQLVGVLWYGCRYYNQLPYACFMQTFVFVTFNKVCTSQYFIWYIGLLPMAYPYMAIDVKKSIIMLIAWLFGQASWLFFAYLYEFKKYDVLFLVWLASINFLVINCCLIYQFTASFRMTNMIVEEKEKTK